MVCVVLPRIVRVHSNNSQAASVRDAGFQFQSSFSYIVESVLSDFLKIVSNWDPLVMADAHCDPPSFTIVGRLGRDDEPEVFPICLLQDEKPRNPPDLFGANLLVTLKDFANLVASIINELRQVWLEASHHSPVVEAFATEEILRSLPTWDECAFGRLTGGREKLRQVLKILDLANMSSKLLERAFRRLWREAERNGGS